MRLYLASTSPARLGILRAAGIEPVLLSPGVDERAVEAEAGPLDGIVLGGYSAFELDGVLYGKPHRADVARERWLAQRGRTGVLHSGHWVVDHRGGVRGRSLGGVSSAKVTFADVTDAEIDAYIATGEPLSVAGAFTLDSLGGAFITRVEGDPHAVIGLSISLLRDLLTRLDVEWPSLWNLRD